MAPVQPAHRPRVITYYQTHHDAAGKPISVLPLLTQNTGITHLILAAIHLNEDPHAITLNDHPPSDPRFATLWAELRVLQASSVVVMGMLGGAAPGTYARLGADEETFERYYVPLRDLVREKGLDGLDLDVEEHMPLSAIVRLIDRLRADFGPKFIISLAPVAAALLDPRANLSGFDYEALEVMRGKEIAFYNTQFYCGWGSCEDALMVQYIAARGWPLEKVVVGLVTNPENGGGYVDWARLGPVLAGMKARWPRFGGVMGWEYFNSLPGGKERPWEWAMAMSSIFKGVGVEAAAAQEKASTGSGGLVDGDDGAKNVAPTPSAFEYFTDNETDEQG